ncbi:MAG: hypothetical protein ACI8QD_002757, partial [Cyclobacteriaceae bacterium]
MKNVIISMLLLCATVTAFAQKKVASVNFSMDKRIDAGNLGGGAALLQGVMQLADDPNFDVKPVFDSFYKEFHENFATEFPFDLLDEEVVLGDAAYQAYSPSYAGTSKLDSLGLTGRYVIVKEGYKGLQRPVLGIGKQDQEAMTEIFKDRSDAILMTFVGFEFVEQTIMKIGVIKVRAFFNMVAYDNDGKKIFSIIEYGTSKNSVPSVLGVPVLKLEKIMPM